MSTNMTVAAMDRCFTDLPDHKDGVKSVNDLGTFDILITRNALLATRCASRRGLASIERDERDLRGLLRTRDGWHSEDGDGALVAGSVRVRPRERSCGAGVSDNVENVNLAAPVDGAVALQRYRLDGRERRGHLVLGKDAASEEIDFRLVEHAARV